MSATLQNNIPDARLQLRGQSREKDNDDPRGVYFRDATAIVHSTAFRRLRHKTQVFSAPANDHICTRLEHVLHVSSVAVTICRALNLDTDLAWAIGIGHDLGHTPFGHLGETVLAKLTGTAFCHELHSLRVVDKLSNLNLSYAVRDGIVTHCGEKFEQAISPTHSEQPIETFTGRDAHPATFEGCVIRMADKIAYLGRDYEDAVTLGVLKKQSLPAPVVRVLGSDTNSDSINIFTRDLIEYAKQHGAIGFSARVYDAMCSFKEFNYHYIYKSELLIKQDNRLEKLLSILYEHLHDVIHRYGGDTSAYRAMENIVDNRLGEHLEDRAHLYNLNSNAGKIQALTDFIAGMTDDFVISSVRGLLFLQTGMQKL